MPNLHIEDYGKLLFLCQNSNSKIFKCFFCNMQISVMYLVYIELSFELTALERSICIYKKRVEALLTSSLLKSKIPLVALAGVAQLLGVLSNELGVCGFDSWSRCMPRLWVWSQAGAPTRGKLTWIFLSLLSPLSKINKHVL